MTNRELTAALKKGDYECWDGNNIVTIGYAYKWGHTYATEKAEEILEELRCRDMCNTPLTAIQIYYMR
jgi:hypothetical protein